MKILAIKVSKLRGLVNFEFEPKGKSLVVCGPNGSGKSALVDAIDFLLTGKISRLEGKGTGDISLQKHGPHIDHKVPDAIVSAEISLSNGKKFNVERRISEPTKWRCDPSRDSDIEEAMSIAERGYHVLSRREVLTYIAADAGTRAQQIQALLNLEKVESLRKILLGGGKDSEKAANLRQSDIETQQRDIARILGLASFTETAALAAINAHRAQLQGVPIDLSQLSSPKIGLKTLEESSSLSRPIMVDGDIRSVQFDGATRDIVIQAEATLKEYLKEVRSNTSLQEELDSFELVDLGISLLGDASKCPLCHKSWDSNELRNFLADRKKNAKRAQEIQKGFTDSAHVLAEKIGVLGLALPRLIKAAEELGQEGVRVYLNGWHQKWVLWKRRLDSPLADYPSADADSIMNDCVDLKGVSQELEKLKKAAAQNSPAASSQQIAYDALTKFEVAWQLMARTEKQRQASGQLKIRFQTLDLVRNCSDFLLSYPRLPANPRRGACCGLPSWPIGPGRCTG